ncbi:hypothetical protein PanWU01x14_143400 [Parasponia andersonii]|uniref:Uncharacterized protein n=1 Tax=Parasponia andersonii TaxID=3476 RepID=A0A2P5CKW6_PARAD|nr:hypothetical protein PanWU01x14_143400 [Parasponia andersonii]
MNYRRKTPNNHNVIHPADTSKTITLNFSVIALDTRMHHHVTKPLNKITDISYEILNNDALQNFEEVYK